MKPSDLSGRPALFVEARVFQFPQGWAVEVKVDGILIGFLIAQGRKEAREALKRLQADFRRAGFDVLPA